MSETDNYCSPPSIVTRLVELYGGPVDIDPCSNLQSIVQARVSYLRGGLILKWCLDGRSAKHTCYENFPYSRGDEWTAKLLAELKNRNVREHVRLCMFASSTKWWARMCMEPQRNPRILALKKFAFLDPSSQDGSVMPYTCRFEPALIYIGPRPARFDRIFAPLTRWSTWGRS